MTELQLFGSPLDVLPFQVAIGATARTVATEFSVTSGEWWLSEMRLWRNSWELAGPLRFRVYTVVSAAVGTPLAGSDATVRVSGLGWQTARLAVPVKLTTGQVYRVCCWAPRGVNYQTGFWATGVTNGALSAPSRATSVGVTQGAYLVGTSLAYPTTDGGSINWYVDITVTDVDPALVSVPLAAALDAPEHQPLVTLRADWARDGYTHALSDVSAAVAELTVNRSVTGDLPVEAGLVEGYAAAQLTATLHGAFADGITDVFDVLAPYRTDSPLVSATLENAPLTCDLGLATDSGPMMVRQFTGRVRSIRADSGTRQVDLSSLDPAEQLRASITLPVYGLSWTTLPWSIKPQAVIDYILRANGIYASPPPFPDAQVCCTGHGWLVAEIGATTLTAGGTTTISDPPFWVPGPFDMLAVRGNWLSPVIQQFYARDQTYRPDPGYGIGFCAWVRIGDGLDFASLHGQLVQLQSMAVGGGPLLEVRIYGDGRVGAFVGSNGSIRTITSPLMQWRYVGVHFSHLAGNITRITFRVDGSTTTADVTTPAKSGDYAPYPMITMISTVDWSNMSVWFAPTAPTVWTGETHASQASLDAGHNELTHLPDITGADSWNLIQDVAGAELGIVGFDESGLFYFRERADLIANTNAQTLTADRELLAVAAVSDIDSLRNVVSTRVSPTTLANHGNRVTIFQADRVDQFDTPTGTTDYYVLVPWGAMGSYLDRGQVPRLAYDAWNDNVTEGYFPVRASDPDTELGSFLIKVWWSVLPGGRFGKLTVNNLSTYTARLALPIVYQPALRVSGYQLVPAPTQTVQATDAASIAAHGPRVLTLPESAWRQLPAPMQDLTTALVGTLAISRAVFEVSALGDPRRKVGDTVIISDPGGQGTITGLIVSITRRYSDRGLIDDLTVRSAT